MITDYAREHGILLVDYFTALRDSDDAMDARYRRDAVHPNLDGYKVMEETFLKVFGGV